MFHLFKWIDKQPDQNNKDQDALTFNLDIGGYGIKGSINLPNSIKMAQLAPPPPPPPPQQIKQDNKKENKNELQNMENDIKDMDQENKKVKQKSRSNDKSSYLLRLFYSKSSKHRLFVHAFSYNRRTGHSKYGIVCFKPHEEDKQKQPSKMEKRRLRLQAISRYRRYPIFLNLKKNLNLEQVRVQIEKARVSKGCYDHKKRQEGLDKAKNMVRYFYSKSSNHRIFTHAFKYDFSTGQVVYGATCWKPSDSKKDVFKKAEQRAFALKRLLDQPVILPPFKATIDIDAIREAIEARRIQPGGCFSPLGDLQQEQKQYAQKIETKVESKEENPKKEERREERGGARRKEKEKREKKEILMDEMMAAREYDRQRKNALDFKKVTDSKYTNVKVEPFPFEVIQEFKTPLSIANTSPNALQL